jgi:hypothetical protein
MNCTMIWDDGRIKRVTEFTKGNTGPRAAGAVFIPVYGACGMDGEFILCRKRVSESPTRPAWRRCRTPARSKDSCNNN